MEKSEESEGEFLRVIRVYEFTGPRKAVERQVRQSIHGSRVVLNEGEPVKLKGTTIGEYGIIEQETDHDDAIKIKRCISTLRNQNAELRRKLARAEAELENRNANPDEERAPIPSFGCVVITPEGRIGKTVGVFAVVNDAGRSNRILHVQFGKLGPFEEISEHNLEIYVCDPEKLDVAGHSDVIRTKART